MRLALPAPTRLARALALAALTACGGSCSGGARQVTVSTLDHLWAHDGSERLVTSGGYLSVTLAPDDGGADIVATEASPGVFVAAAVPPGGYTLRAAGDGERRLELHAMADRIDLGFDGARSYTGPAALGTVAWLNMSGLLPWDPAADTLALQCRRAGLWEALTPALPVDATSRQVSFEWPAWADLLEGSDHLLLHQLRRQPVGAVGDFATSVIAAASITGYWMVDGERNDMAPRFSAPSASQAITVRWRTSAFDGALPGTHPRPRYAIGVMAQPASVAAPVGFTSLLAVEGPPGVLLPDRDDGQVVYQRAAPEGWLEYLAATFDSAQERTDPVGGGVATIDAAVLRLARVDDGLDPIEPGISGARDVTVAGLDASVAQAGVGSGPVIAWSPPAVGTATSARVTVRAFRRSASTTYTVPLAQFVTTGRSVQLPPGTLQAGQGYVATVTTISSPADRPETAPWRRGLPWSEARVVTAVFTP